MNGERKTYFAGGCFWGVEAYFRRMPWVVSTRVGYANGKDGTVPRYETLRETGHAETVEVVYRADALTLKTLVRRFFEIIDPLSVNRQGHDSGTQYRTGVFFVGDGVPSGAASAAAVEEVFDEVKTRLGARALATVCEPLRNWFPAEEYHQEYLQKNAGGYCHVPGEKLRRKWPLIDGERYPRPDGEELRRRLSRLEFDVVENAATEMAGTGELENVFERGIYVDRATGEPLFVSAQKYHSGCGWPAFSKPIDEAVLERVDDDTIPGRPRIEVRSSSGSHLGHVFTDGPDADGGLAVDLSADSAHRPARAEGGNAGDNAGGHALPQDPTGLRYCINSAALRFVPFDRMDDEGYGYLKDFVTA